MIDQDLIKKYNRKPKAIVFLILALVIIAIIALLVVNFTKNTQPNVNQAYVELVQNLSELQKKAESNPEDAAAVSEYAYALYVTGDTQKSIETYEALSAANMSSADDLNTLGNVYRRSKQYTKAIESYNYSIQKDPNQIHAYINLAQLYIQNLNNYEQGVATFNQVLSLHPNETNILYMLAKVHEREGNNEEAKKIYDQILVIKPNDQSASQALQLLNQ